MATVEGYGNLKASISNAPSQRASGALTEAQATVGPKQLMKFGEAVEGFGDTQAKIEINEMYEASQVRVDDALNQAREAALRLTYDPKEGYTNLRGRDALERPDGRPLEEEYVGKLKTSVSEIEGQLGNDYQKKEFAKRANDLVTTFGGSVMQHEGTEARNYSLSVADGTAKIAIDDITAHWDDPNATERSIASLKAATYQKGKLNGKSAVEIDADLKTVTSGAHALAIDAALASDDVLAADDYLRANSKNMNAADIVNANTKLAQQYDKKTALLAVRDVMTQAAPKIKTPDEERAFNIALGTESNYQQFDKSGKPLTSSAGAVGIAQVMPATGPEAAALAGLEWNPELFNRKRTGDPVKDAEAERYSRALGKAYFEKQLQDFGTLPQAYAAYNAGPGATRKAVEMAAKVGGDWLTLLPKETQDYVAKNMKQFADGGGAYAKPTLAELQTAVKEKVGTDSPDRLNLAMQETARQYKIMEDTITANDDIAVADAMKTVMQNNGDLASLTPDMRAKIPKGSMGQVEKFAAKIANGDDTSDLWLYNKLSSDPQYLKSLSDAQFVRLRAELSQDDFRHFAGERNRLLTGKTTESATALSMDGVNSILNDRLRIMGIDPSASGKDAARVGAIRRYVTENLLTQQAGLGRKLNTGEISQGIDFMFAKNTLYDGFGIFTSGDTSGPMLGMKASDIPTEIKSRLKETFKKIGVDKPADGDMLNAYWRLMTKPKAK